MLKRLTTYITVGINIEKEDLLKTMEIVFQLIKITIFREFISMKESQLFNQTSRAIIRGEVYQETPPERKLRL